MLSLRGCRLGCPAVWVSGFDCCMELRFRLLFVPLAGVSGFGFGLKASELRVSGFWAQVQGLRLRVSGARACRDDFGCSGFRASCEGLQIWSSAPFSCLSLKEVYSKPSTFSPKPQNAKPRTQNPQPETLTLNR